MHPRGATIDIHLMLGSRSGSQAQEPKPSSGPVWDVQDILAERTSLTGENEVLVVWKPSWEPLTNVRADGPAMTRFRATASWKFTSRAGGVCVMLPVEKKTTLAVDRSVATQMAAVKRPKRDREVPAAAASATGPRKALGSTAKRSPDFAAAASH